MYTLQTLLMVAKLKSLCYNKSILGPTHSRAKEETYMHILLVNDDGIHAEGIRALCMALKLSLIHIYRTEKPAGKMPGRGGGRGGDRHGILQGARIPVRQLCSPAARGLGHRGRKQNLTPFGPVESASGPSHYHKSEGTLNG